MSPIDNILPRLDKVRRTQPGRWSACCPAHDDKSPSLSVRETPSGSVLLYCFAGCSIDAITNALGIFLEDLFPPRPDKPGSGTPRERQPFNAVDVLRLCAHEAMVVVLETRAMLDGKPHDRERLIEAAARLQSAAEVAHARV
jgi:hypothetical protein